MTIRSFLYFLAPMLFVGPVFGQGYKIETSLNGQEDTVAYLGHHFATQRYVDDTAKVIDGNAVFAGVDKLEEGIYFYYSNSVYFEFLISDQNFSISGDANDVVKTAEIKGSSLNEGFYAMQRNNFIKRNEAQAIRTQLDSLADETQIIILKEQLNDIEKDIKAFQKDLQRKYPESLLDRLILLMQTPEVPAIPEGEDSLVFRYSYYKSHFWDGIDIADPGLLRSPLLHNKILDYLDNVIIQQVDTVIQEVDKLIELSRKNPEAYRYLLISLTNKYASPKINGHDEVFVNIVDKYYLTGGAPWTNEETLKKLEERASSIRPNFIGNLAPTLELQDTLGTNYNLYDIKARYTVLFFYDPDCGHCKKSAPLLYEAYADMRTKGVEVLAICTTTDRKRWMEFIEEFDLDWVNLADLTASSHMKYYYDVRSTPTVYILDEDKKIILKKIPTENVPEIIDQLIAKTEEN